MGAPDHPDDFVRVVAEDLTLFVSRDVLSSLKPRQTRFLVAVGGYGRFWVELLGEGD